MDKSGHNKGHYWIISISKTSNSDIYTKLRDLKTKKLCTYFEEFKIPSNFKVGTLDALVSLGDILSKYDSYIEGVVKKIGRQRFELMSKEMRKAANIEIRDLNGNDVGFDQYLTEFTWEEQKFSKKRKLNDLSDIIFAGVNKADEELKDKILNYNAINSKIKQLEKRIGGSLLVKDLSTVVDEKELMETEYIKTLLVVVPKNDAKKWESSYEYMANYVVPRSSILITQDNEYNLYSVKIFKVCEEEFKETAKSRRFTVRYLEKIEGTDTLESLEEEKEKLRLELIRWCETNFQEAYRSWIHLKCIRCFVESILRFGIDNDFEVFLLLPDPKQETKLRKLLAEAVGQTYDQELEDDISGHLDEKYYPYVSLDVDLDFRYEK